MYLFFNYAILFGVGGGHDLGPAVREGNLVATGVEVGGAVGVLVHGDLVRVSRGGGVVDGGRV